MTHLKVKNLVSEEQYGFISGRCWTEALDEGHAVDVLCLAEDLVSVNCVHIIKAEWSDCNLWQFLICYQVKNLLWILKHSVNMD